MSESVKEEKKAAVKHEDWAQMADEDEDEEEEEQQTETKQEEPKEEDPAKKQRMIPGTYKKNYKGNNRRND